MDSVTMKCLLVWDEYGRLVHSAESGVLMLDDSQVPELRPMGAPRGHWDRAVTEGGANEVFDDWLTRERRDKAWFEGKILLLNFERMDGWSVFQAEESAKLLIGAALAAGFAGVYWYGGFAKRNPALLALAEGCMLPANTVEPKLGAKDVVVLHPFEHGTVETEGRIRRLTEYAPKVPMVLWGVTRREPHGNHIMDRLIGYRRGWEDGAPHVAESPKGGE